jgi:parallel beta-helix repeat protein
MKTFCSSLMVVGIACLTCNAQATTHYVDLNCTSPVSPYTNWVTAATNIQSAIDVAGPGDLIWVTNGVYKAGARADQGSNRVAITKAVTVQSVSGPASTFIQGLGMMGLYAVRCAYLTNGAVLSGFTLTNGATQATRDGGIYTNWNGGCVWCEGVGAVITNCVLTGCTAQNYGGAAYYGTLNSCTLVSNTAYGGGGGGAYYATLNNCTLRGNYAFGTGGGAYYGALTNCTLVGNSADNDGGGGAYAATLDNCILTNNSTRGYGGGAYSATLNNCTLMSNSAGDSGGGAADSKLNNCTLTGNSAYHGAGASWGTLNNCTLMGNSAYAGGGASWASLNNCTLMSNSAYSDAGGAFSTTLSNCMLISNTAQNYGGGASGGTLDKCVLTGNSSQDGGGASIATLNNCTLAGNTAYLGGGAYISTLTNSTLTGNSANSSGGAYGGSFNNCTLVSNWATNSGGGVGFATLYNCIICYNTASNEANYYQCSLTNCCTTPLPGGVGNTDVVPLFVNTNEWSDLRLQSNSPCINSGNNGYITRSTDLDGNPRIVGGTVDIGAYEYQTPSSVLSYAWAQQYGLSTDGSVDYTDTDGDGMNNWQEWMAGTDPTNALSLLEMLSLASTNSPSGIVVTWQSVTNRAYSLQRSGDLSAQPLFSTIQSNIPGQAGTTTYTDTSATNSGPYFYRVGVQ